MQGKKVLVIDDDIKLRRMMEYTLEKAGAEVFTAVDGKEGLRIFYSEKPDLVILDLMMPNLDGWETCKSIRQLSDIPIVMVTARVQDDDIVRGLEIGADDYIAKPFSPKILIARATAAIRRSETSIVEKTTTTYSDNYLAINFEGHRIFVDGEAIKTTATEFRLLSYLIENAGRVMSFEQILENVWGTGYTDDFNFIRVYIWHLRKKIEKDPKKPEYLINVQGIGYRFEKKG